MWSAANQPRFPRSPEWVGRLCSIGVTGTNGKTTTSFLLAALLERAAPPAALVTTVGAYLGGEPWPSDGSYAAQLELMRACLAAGGRYAVLETTSEVLARGFARSWPFSAGVFTNLSHDHLDAHGGPEHYFASKAQLFCALSDQGLAVVNAADPVADLLFEVIPPAVRRLSYAVADRGARSLACDLSVETSTVTWEGTTFELELGNALPARAVSVRTRGVGSIYVENALAALATAVGLGLSLERCVEALGGVRPPPGRFERVHTAPDVVVDYAHSPDALRRTLDVARRLCRGQLWLVFGAGGNRDADKRTAMSQAAEAADRIVITSDNPRHEDPRRIAEQLLSGIGAKERARIVLDRADAIRGAVLRAAPEDLVLIAGKGHEGVQIVGSEVRPFSDRSVATQAAAERK